MQIISLGIRHKIPVDYEMRRHIVLTNSGAQKTELPLHVVPLQCVGRISSTKWMSKPEVGKQAKLENVHRIWDPASKRKST